MLVDYLKDYHAKLFSGKPVIEADRRYGYNGTILGVDLVQPADHVEDVNLICITNGALDLTESIAYALWVNGGSKNGFAAVTSDIIIAAAPRISHLVVLWNFYRIFTAANLKIVLRGSDAVDLPFKKKVSYKIPDAPAGGPGSDGKGGTASSTSAASAATTSGDDEDDKDAAKSTAATPAVKPAAKVKINPDDFNDYHDPSAFKELVAGVDPDYVAVDHPVWYTAKVLEAHFFDNTNRKAQEIISSVSKYVLFAFFAVGIHRATCALHSWYTAETLKPGTNTYRAGAVAGADKEEFRKFMKSYGHDLIHHVSDTTLDEILDALSAVNDNSKATKFTSTFEYNSVDVNGKALHEVIVLGTACTDRWPVGVMGKGSLVLGIKNISSMLSSIMMRVKVPNGDKVIVALSKLLELIVGKGATSDIVKKCRQSMTSIVCFATGYCVQAAVLQLDDSSAIGALVKTNQQDFSTGKSLADSIIAAPIHTEALSATIVAQFELVIAAIENAAKTELTAMGYTVPPGGTVTDALIGESDADKAQKNMIATLDAFKKGP